MEEQESKTTIPSSRKRQLEPIDPEQEREDERDSESGPPSPKVPATNNNFLDEIELHFQRSLANVKPSQRSPVPTTTATDGNHTHSAVNNQQTRDSPSPNQQSRLTPPTSSSSLTSSPRRHGIHSNKPLPPPLKLASPSSDSQSTVQSLYPHQQLPTIRPPSVTQHQTIILPTITTATRLSRQSPPSSMTGPSAPTIANGLPSGGASPPSVISYSSGGVAQIHALPTISTAALGSGSAGVYIASPQFLSSQQALHQALSNGGSSSPKRTATISGTSTGAAGGAAATTIPVANNACGALAAVQLTPGGPLLALPSSVLQPSTTAAGNSGHNRSRGRTFLNLSSGGTIGGSVGTAGTGTTVAASGGGSYQIHAPSVTQPGSVHIIDLPIESSAGKSSPPTPLLATAPTLPKAPTVVNVSQIPNLVAINPSSPNSPSPGSNKSTPTVKMVGTGSPLLTTGIQSPIRVSSASAQTTPVATPTLITPQQLAANPSLMSVVDPSVSAQLLAAGNTGCSPVYLIPANSMPMVQQPFFIINPSTTTATDLTSVQQLQQANILASNPSLAGASLVSNPAAPGGGYLLVSPGSAGTPANFSMPLVNLASTSSVNSSQPAIPNLIPTSPAITATTLKPANKATILYSTTASSSGSTTGGSGASSRPTAAKPPLINQSSTDSAPSPAHNDVMMTPASVDDHFAQALGPQWNKLKSHNNMQPQQC